MNRVENGRQTRIVVNQMAGDFVGEINQGMGPEVWTVAAGQLGVLNFMDVLKDPSLLDGYNVIGRGGDGSHAWLANQVRIFGGNYWPLDLGSIGDIPKSLGFMRGETESVDGYLKRMISLYNQGKLKVQEIGVGKVTDLADEQSFPFCWTAGGNASAWLLHEIETMRKKNSGKYLRVAAGGVAFMRHLGQDRSMEATVGEEELSVWDINVIKAPFGRFGSLTLPHKEGLIWLIVRPERARDRARKIVATALDIMLMKLGMPPTRQGVEFRDLHNQKIVVETNQQRLQVDSEIIPNRQSIKIEATDSEAVPYRVLSVAG